MEYIYTISQILSFHFDLSFNLLNKTHFEKVSSFKTRRANTQAIHIQEQNYKNSVS